MLEMSIRVKTKRIKVRIKRPIVIRNAIDGRQESFTCLAVQFDSGGNAKALWPGGL